MKTIMKYHMLPASPVNVNDFVKHHSANSEGANQQKAAQTFKCRVLPLANDSGGRCETREVAELSVRLQRWRRPPKSTSVDSISTVQFPIFQFEPI